MIKNLAVLLLILTIPSQSTGQGLIGGALRDLGRATGIRPLEDAGRELDEGHRRLKEAVPPYRELEEGASGAVRDSFRRQCISAFQVLTNAVIFECSNWSGRTGNRAQIEEAVRALVDLRLFDSREFDNVQIRWCPLRGAAGMAPDRGRIYLDISLQGDPISTTSTLAHEMIHIRQYRRMGTDKFKCDYSIMYSRCGGCQDHGHPLEREAYEYEDAVYNDIFNYFEDRSRRQSRGDESRQSRTGMNELLGSGETIVGCGCWGNQPMQSVWHNGCASGIADMGMCPGSCGWGTIPYGYVCR